MKVGNKIITGIYQLREGVEYTPNDLIIYDTKPYIVIGNYIGSESTFQDHFAPDTSPNCKPYLEYLYEGDTSYITTNRLLATIKNYIRGIGPTGIIDDIVIDDPDQYVDTAIYYATINIGTIGSVKGVLSVYKTQDNSIVQEFLVHSGDSYANIYCRVRSNGNWSSWQSILSGDSGFGSLSSKCSELIDKLTDKVSSINSLKTYKLVPSTEDGTQYVTLDIHSGILMINIYDGTSHKQYSKTISFINGVTKYNAETGSNFTINLPDNIDIVFTATEQFSYSITMSAEYYSDFIVMES